MTFMNDAPRIRRSMLFMPGANARAMAKARELPCDGVILDLEDAVAVDAKAEARSQVAATVQAGEFGYRELVVRVNALETPWGNDDLAALSGLPVDGLLFPKVETTHQVDQIVTATEAAGLGSVPLWFMIETPKGVLDVRAIAERTRRLAVLVMGTSDLVKDMRAAHIPDRANLSFALQRCLLVARAIGVEILDGVHLDFRNEETLRAVCEQGRAMGFDGKTLIHPGQIDVANTVFGFDDAAVAHAARVLETWAAAEAAGKGVAELDGKLIENLHAAEAERILAFARALAAR
ncbi:MAG: citrate lyase subunit beta / citryl-CoA lyase [Pseudomonadota bacterium]